eukprot:12664650-Alexandrium_andersonii.AAC.1
MASPTSGSLVAYLPASAQHTSMSSMAPWVSCTRAVRARRASTREKPAPFLMILRMVLQGQQLR